MIARWSFTGKLRPAGRGIRGGAAAKKATNSRASALVPTVRKLKRKGFISQRALADELNRKGIPAPRGGRWYLTNVVRMLTRLGLITVGKGRTNQRLAVKQAADARARTLASTIRKLRKAGFVSVRAITHELSEREILTAQGGKWAPKQRQATAAPRGKAGAFLDRSPAADE
jgi:hypothetical protein